MGAGQGRRRVRASSTSCSPRSSRGCAWSTVLLWPYMPASAERLLGGARRAPTARSRARGSARAIGSVQRARAAVPQGAVRARGVIDSHTHLDLCEPPDAELVAAADAAGVRRILTVGIDGASCRAALAAAEALPGGLRGDRPPPQLGAGGFDDADLAELRALAAHERCVAIGETGLDFYRDARRARPTSSAPSRRRSSSRARSASRS